MNCIFPFSSTQPVIKIDLILIEWILALKFDTIENRLNTGLVDGCVLTIPMLQFDGLN